MIQGEKSVNIYKMNSNVEIQVKTEKVADGAYKHFLTLKATTFSERPFVPETKEDVAAKIRELDLDDEQASLFNNENQVPFVGKENAAEGDAKNDKQ